MTLKARPPRGRSGSEVDISEWSSVIYFSCLTTLTTYDISEVSLYLRPSICPSVSREPHVARRTHDLRVPSRVYVHGYNTTRNLHRERSSLFLSLSLFSSLFLSLARGLFFATGENVYICLLRQLRRTLLAQRAFYSLASPGRDGRGENSSLVTACRGRRQNTHKARLVNYNRRDRPHLHPDRRRRCRRSRAFRISRRRKKSDAGHRMVIAIAAT